MNISRARRNAATLFAALMMIIPAFFGDVIGFAQSRSAKKPTPTPKKKATPTPKRSKAAPTPKKSPAKTNAKKTTKPAPKTNAKTAKTPPKSSTSKSDKSKKAANSKSSTKPNTKTATKVPAKPSVKTPPKTASKTPVKSQTDSTKASKVPTGTEVVVSGFAVPVRSEARSSSPALTRIRIGSVLKVTEKSGSWTKVQYKSGGKTATGWIASNAVNDPGSDRAQTFRQIAEKNYRNDLDFGSAAELYEFMGEFTDKLDQSDASGEFELKRLLTLRSALKSIPQGESNSEPFSSFTKTHENAIVYNEPAGAYIVASNQFWDLHSKYAKHVISDSIAWEAALNPLPGECEGYINCHLFDLRMRFGEYLNLHPNGRHAAEALANITNYLEPVVADSGRKEVYNGPTDVTDRAEFNNLVAELRTIVARLSFVEKERTLQQLKQIAEAYR